ncbi:MAG: RNA 2',3'-cyclic phosphodiesterase [Trueperaceae bacterium]
MRLFVAAHPPRAVLDETDRAERFLRQRLPALRARFVPARQRHLTFSFLGEVADAAVEDVMAAVHGAASAARPFELRTAGLGAFPGPRRARVLWLGLSGPTSDAGDLARDLASRMLPEVPGDATSGAFVPHVTLARLKGDGGGARPDVGEVLPAYVAADVPWRITRVSLYASLLTPEGAQHRVLAHADLGADDPVERP